MRGIQYFDFVEVFHCLTALERNMLVVMTVRTVLEVPFEKAAPPPLPFRRSGTPGCLWLQQAWFRITSVVLFLFFF